MEDKKYNILIVDDEEDIRQIVGYNLLREGFLVQEAESAEQALSFNLQDFDLILLDVMMEGMDGFQMAQKLKENIATKDIPIIFLTAKTAEEDTVHGLKLGGDDYISKPFSIKELLARVQAVLRRCQSEKHNKPVVLQYHNLVLQEKNKTVTIEGKEIPFTKTEFDVLNLLLKHQGTIFSRTDILKRIWPKDVCVIDRTVDVTIARIRKKIGYYSKNIATKAGAGYWFRVTE